jgi:hypothetical protein
LILLAQKFRWRFLRERSHNRDVPQEIHPMPHTRARREPMTFAGHTQEALLDLVLRSATDAARKAVADNAARGLNSPGTRGGRLVIRKPDGNIVLLKN